MVWHLEPPSGEPAADQLADDDVAAMRRAADGDERAWQELFDRWKKPLLAFFYRSLGTAPEAEDLTLEVFVRLHRAAPGYRPHVPFPGYIFHIARNLLLNELRRRKRHPIDPVPVDTFEYLEAPAIGPASRLADLEEAFQRALAQLPEQQRTVLLLVHQQQLEQTAAAAVLGITPNALRVYLHRAREQLRKLMSVSLP